MRWLDRHVRSAAPAFLILPAVVAYPEVFFRASYHMRERC